MLKTLKNNNKKTMSGGKKTIIKKIAIKLFFGGGVTYSPIFIFKAKGNGSIKIEVKL